MPESERGTGFAETLGRAGFEDFDAEAATLSGGWQKRLAIVEALVQSPGHPACSTNPPTIWIWPGIEWLEKLLQGAPFACVVVSHDRYFLENVATQMAELNRTYPDGIFDVAGNYSAFLETERRVPARAGETPGSAGESVHREIEWLRRGAKARTSKSKARIDKAGGLMGELADLNSRSRTANAGIDFSATGPQDQAPDRTRRCLLRGSMTARCLTGSQFCDHRRDASRAGGAEWQRQDHAAAAAARRDSAPTSWSEIHRADCLRIVYFDQTPPTRSGYDASPRPRARRRFRDLSRPA